jgi:hypothetical protein
LYFNGNDSFNLRFLDNHEGFQKFFDISFNIVIKSNNSAPFITSDKPEGRVIESSFFQHSFDVFDAEEDFYELSFYNLPNWIKFDGRRKIFGTPQRADFQESPQPIFLSVTDQWGNSFTDKFFIEVVPQNYPPQISFLDQNESQISFDVLEDTSLSFELSAHDRDGEAALLEWKVSMSPFNGDITLDTNGTGPALINYSPDGNFSGSDYVEILVYEVSDEMSSDLVRVFIDVLPVPDSPKFKSKPYPGIVRDKSWVYEVVGLDGDSNDNLTLTSLSNLPEWLRLDQTNDRIWTFRGLPTSNESFDISLVLSDGNTSVEQAFTLKVLESLEPLTFLPHGEFPLIDSQGDRGGKESNVSLEEDGNWSLNFLSVNAVEDIRVLWEVTRPPENGVFSFDSVQNGMIENIYYQPNPNFNGSDQVELLAFDNYSSVKLELHFEITSVADEIRFLEFPEGLLENSDEKFDFTITYQDGDGLSTLDEIVLIGFPSWLTREIIFQDEITKSFRFFGEPTVDHIGIYELNASVANIDDTDSLSKSFDLKVNFYNKPPVPSISSIYEKITEDSYSEENPKMWRKFISIYDEETKDPNAFSWAILNNPKYGVAQISERGDWMSYFPENNFSGVETFSIKVTDQVVLDEHGSFISSPRSVEIPITIEVAHVNDKPIFTTFPPSKSNLSTSVVWSDEETFRYEVVVDDSDWPWQGYPLLKLKSSLPSWAKWEPIGNGKAILSGDPKWFDEGNYTFDISASNGPDVVSQIFVLEIRVDDYPPRIFDSSGNELNQRIQIFIVEDNHNGEVDETLNGLSAINPDKSSGESLMWVPYLLPSSGGTIFLNTILNLDKSIASISDFSYSPPKDFNGIDTFTLLVDEGDRFTTLKVDVHVKAVPDPPVFLESGPLHLKVSPNSFIDYLIMVNDPDGENLTFRLLYSGNQNKWLTIRDSSNDFVRVAGTVPSLSGNESLSLVVSDSTGRFSILSIYIEID